jgi:hypothetical protein
MSATLSAVLLVCGALSQEKVTIKFAPKAGSVVTSTEKSTFDMKGSFSGQEFEVSSRTTERVESTFAELAGGKVSKKVMYFESSVKEEKGPGAEEYTRSETPVHGKRITLTPKGESVSTEGADGIMDDESLKKLRLDEAYEHLQPGKAVAVGESWEVKGEALLKFTNDKNLAGGRITCTLKEVKEVDKRRCAIVATKWEITGEGEQAVKFELNMDGEVTIWLERGIPLSQKSSGRLKLSQEGGFEGEGTISIEEESTIKE